MHSAPQVSPKGRANNAWGAHYTVARIALIMTRPAGSNEAFVARISPDVRGLLEVIESPLIAIHPLAAEPSIGATETVIFTSANGVRCAPAGQGRAAFCIGSHTTDVARQNGWSAERAGSDADELVAYLLAHRPKTDLHHLSGVHTRGAVAERLNAAGLSVKHTPIYDQKLVPLTDAAHSLISSDRPVIVPLFSPRAASQFAACASRVGALYIVAMSTSVAQALPRVWSDRVEIARVPDACSMAEAVEKKVKRLRLA